MNLFDVKFNLNLSRRRGFCWSQKWWDIPFTSTIPWRFSEESFWFLGCIFAVSTGPAKEGLLGTGLFSLSRLQRVSSRRARGPPTDSGDFAAPAHLLDPQCCLRFCLPPTSLSRTPSLARGSFVFLNQYFALICVLFLIQIIIFPPSWIFFNWHMEGLLYLLVSDTQHSDSVIHTCVLIHIYSCSDYFLW